MWEDRLREAAYTSPSGTRITFAYVSVSRAVTKRTAAFEFPGVDGAYVQDNGHGAHRHPMVCFFSGADHDLEAEAFEAALLERGVGRLEHPFYGAFDAVPFGDITRRDDLRDAANQTVVETTFWPSFRAVYPNAGGDAASEAAAELEVFSAAAGEQFEDGTDLTTTAARATVAARWESMLGDVSRSLRDVAAADAEVTRQFEDAQGAILLGMDVLIGQPLALVSSTVATISAPAEAGGRIEERLEAYLDLATNIIASPPAKPWEAFVGTIVLPGRRRAVSNDFRSAAIFGLSSVAGAVASVLATEFAARPQAVAAADSLLAHLDTVTAWMDTGFSALEGLESRDLDTGEAYQAVQSAVAIAAGYLVGISFSLLPERRLVTDRPRTIIDVAAEVYGSVSDERLDFLIETNGLSGSEILEIPRGTSLVYYA